MPGVLPLTILCENLLLHYHFQLRDLGDTRYDLIQRVLLKCNPQQLMLLESSNPRLLLDDEKIWFHLLQKQFPQDVHERFTTNPGKIIQFYKQELNKLNFDYSDLDLNNHVKIISVAPNLRKYRLPSKLLFLKYTEDASKKEEVARENLRKKMKSIQQAREKTKVIQIDKVIPIEKPRPFIRSKPERSRLFQKSQTEAKRHKDHFKNPLSEKMTYPAPLVNCNQPEVPTIIQPIPKTITNPVTSNKVTKPVSPSKPKNVSIFLTQRSVKPPRKKSQTSMSTPSITPKRQDNMSQSQTPGSATQATALAKDPKKIKLVEYLSRKC